MAGRDIIPFTEHLSFSGSGTQTVSALSSYHIVVTGLDVSSAAARIVTVMAGSTTIWKATTDVAPRQFTFGQKGRGSGVADEDITVTSNGAIEMDIVGRQYKEV